MTVNHIGDTIRIRRPPPKVFTDELGRTTWMSGVEPCPLELENDRRRCSDPYNSVDAPGDPAHWRFGGD